MGFMDSAVGSGSRLPTHHSGSRYSKRGLFSSCSDAGRLSSNTVLTVLLVVLMAGCTWSRHALTQDVLACKQREEALKHSERQLQDLRREAQDTREHGTRTSHAVRDELASMRHQAARDAETAQALRHELEGVRQQAAKDTEEATALIDTLQDELEYEKKLVQLLTQKLGDLEHAHREREDDWQALGKKWAEYEQLAIAENTRLNAEVSKLRRKPAPAPAAAPMPAEQPQVRKESRMDFKIDIPQYTHQHDHHELTHTAGSENVSVTILEAAERLQQVEQEESAVAASVEQRRQRVHTAQQLQTATEGSDAGVATSGTEHSSHHHHHTADSMQQGVSHAPRSHARIAWHASEL